MEGVGMTDEEILRWAGKVWAKKANEARMVKTTPEQRKAQGRMAVNVRWAKYREAKAKAQDNESK